MLARCWRPATSWASFEGRRERPALDHGAHHDSGMGHELERRSSLATNILLRPSDIDGKFIVNKDYSL